MWIADQWKDYEVLDTSGGEKLERGEIILPGAARTPRSSGTLPARPGAGKTATLTTTAVKKGAEAGNSLICPSSADSL